MKKTALMIMTALSLMLIMAVLVSCSGPEELKGEWETYQYIDGDVPYNGPHYAVIKRLDDAELHHSITFDSGKKGTLTYDKKDKDGGAYDIKKARFEYTYEDNKGMITFSEEDAEDIGINKTLEFTRDEDFITVDRGDGIKETFKCLDLPEGKAFYSEGRTEYPEEGDKEATAGELQYFFLYDGTFRFSKWEDGDFIDIEDNKYTVETEGGKRKVHLEWSENARDLVSDYECPEEFYYKDDEVTIGSTKYYFAGTIDFCDDQTTEMLHGTVWEGKDIKIDFGNVEDGLECSIVMNGKKHEISAYMYGNDGVFDVYDEVESYSEDLETRYFTYNEDAIVLDDGTELKRLQ